jgi:riboflavin biosynthesis pyrimidine reductase
MIASLDGGATVDGRSAGLGNKADEALFGLLRDLADVILVGAGTARAEKYAGIRLSPRRQERRQRWGLSAAPPPIAVVSGRGLDASSLLLTDTETPPIVITTKAGAERLPAGTVPAGTRVVVAGEDRVDLRAAIAALADDGFRRIHCEGGPALLASLVEADLVDECCLTLAPLLLGSRSARMLPAALADPARWELVTARRDGGHLFLRYSRAGR